MKYQRSQKMSLFPKLVGILILVGCVYATALALGYRTCTADESSAPPSVMRLILKPDGVFVDCNDFGFCVPACRLKTS